MQEMSETITQLAQRADDTMRRLNATLTPENIAAFTEILDNLRRVSRRVDAMLAKADATFASAGRRRGRSARAGEAPSRPMPSTLTQKYASLGTDATASIGEIRAGRAQDERGRRPALAAGRRASRERGRGVARNGAGGPLRGGFPRRRRRSPAGPAPGDLRAARGRSRPRGEVAMKIDAVLPARPPAWRPAPSPGPASRIATSSWTRGLAAVRAALRHFRRRGADNRVELLRHAGHRVQPGARHACLLPVQPLDRAAAAKHPWAARVAARGRGPKGGLRLDTHLDEIYHDATEQPGTARITITAELRDPAGGTLLARRTFTRSAPAASYDAPGAVRGFNQALAALIDDIEGWVESEARPKSPR